MASRDEFVEKALELVNLELQAETKETTDLLKHVGARALEKKGLCIQRLCVVDAHVGFGGRYMVKFGNGRPGDQNEELPSHKMSTGDVVSVRPSVRDKDATVTGNEDSAKSGVVCRVSYKHITVAFDLGDWEDASSGPCTWRMDVVANDVTFQRYRHALGTLKNYKSGCASRLISCLFGDTQPSFEGMPRIKDLVKKDSCSAFGSLNATQQEAIAYALSAQDVALIHGPPGTGKTTTVCELIRQAVLRGDQVLACAPSNVAVDNMVEKLATSSGKRKLKIVRIGHPARLLPQVLDHSLEVMLRSSDGSKLVNDIQKEIAVLERKIKKTKDKRERASMRMELRVLGKEVSQREQRAVSELLRKMDVVLCTNTGADARDMRKLDFHFDLCVIDEAAQALECSCWIPILKSKRLVLAGDHLQLPPTITSTEAERKGLGVTLFDRLIEMYGETITKMLCIQYRMHKDISDWASNELYNSKLIPHESVASHTLSELPNVGATRNTSNDICTDTTIVLVDTAGCDMIEQEEDEGESKLNCDEAAVVEKYVRSMMNDCGLTDRDIGVITPYNGQKGKLRELLHGDYPNLEISSVDGFQGREKECIIISCVRSNSNGVVGFLADKRRMNVAITRARRHLCLVCDSDTLSTNPFLDRIVQYCTDNGDYRSAEEFRE